MPKKYKKRKPKKKLIKVFTKVILINKMLT